MTPRALTPRARDPHGLIKLWYVPTILEARAEYSFRAEQQFLAFIGFSRFRADGQLQIPFVVLRATLQHHAYPRQSLKPDVVIMDIAMRELNGIEAARLLRDQCPATRVVMLSMHSSSEHVFRALEAGAAGFVLKESAGEEVAAAVRAAHAGRRYLSRAIDSCKLSARSRAGRASPLDSLSASERQTLQMVVEGRSSAEIAATVHLSPKTVETYRGRLMKKLGVSNVTDLVKFAIKHGLTPPG